MKATRLAHPKAPVPRYTSLMTRLLGLFVLLAGFACAQNRVYELRTYTCNEGKLEALKARFRDHTIEIFKRHGIESVGYWVPQDPEKSKTTLIYIVVHPSLEAAQKNWTDFRNDPEWKKVSADSELNGKIVAKVESVFMDPADFSKLK
jgi:capsule polysaccharide export protein KpsE/RkpR